MLEIKQTFRATHVNKVLIFEVSVSTAFFYNCESIILKMFIYYSVY